MSPSWMRPWLMLFFALSGTVMFNLFILQSGRETAVARHRAPYAGDRAVAYDPIVPGVERTSAGGPRQPVADGGEATELIRAIQRELGSRGYETGGSDGMPGLLTRAGIMAYEHDHGLQLTGEASETLLQTILFGRRDKAMPAVAANTAPRGPAERVIRLVQQQLKGLGYPLVAADGRLSPEMERAIRAFETAQGLSVTGRISGQLVARLGRQPAPAPGRIAQGQ